ncbi:hypothetical protein FQ031_19835, partial [Escherichia coli]|uniref:hypothetical protein n=1 Tax=Escherichia coli TaxID=562 RepID=UPI00142B6B79
ADRNRSHWSTSKTPSYTKSVSWQHHPPGKVFTLRGGTLNMNIPGRSALLLGKTGEPPNYLYL